MPSSTRSNKEIQLLFSLDPASLERSIHKGKRSSSIGNNTCSSLDSRQPPSTQTPVSSTDTRLPPSAEDTLPSTDIFHPTSIDTEPRDMVAILILVRDEKGDLHDQEGHLRNAADDDFWQVVKQEKLQEEDFEVESSMSFSGSHWCRSTPDLEHRSTDVNQNRSIAIPEHRSTKPTESTASCNAVRIMTHEEFPARHPHLTSHVYVKLDRQTDVARLNALRPQTKPSANPPETTSKNSDDAAEPMEVDKAPIGRTLRKRKGKEAYFTHRLWMFFRETRETEEHIRRMFCEAREKMNNRITLKKSDPEKFAVPCTVKGIEFPHALCDIGASVSILPRVMADHLDLKIGNALVPVDFHVLHIKLNWNSSMFLGRAFLSTVGAMCNMQTNQLCLTLIDPHVYYDPILVMKPQTSSRRIDDPRLIATCHCGAEYETEYSTSIKTHTATSIDSANQKSIDIHKDKSIDSSPGNWENDYYNPTMEMHSATLHTEDNDNDYEEEQAIEYRVILAEEDRLLHYYSWKRNGTSIDKTVPTSIDTHLHQTSCKQASTDISYYTSIDTGVNRVREGDYSIGSWADDHYHERYAVETLVHERGVDEPREGIGVPHGVPGDIWVHLELKGVAVHHIPERLSQSDRTKSLAFSRPETHRFDPGATSQSDVPKSLPMFRATCWSDTPRSLASSRPETPKSSILERPLRATYQGRSQPERPAQVARVLTGRDTKKRVGSDLLERINIY
ncbi:hypothetical protein DY000_02053746 [Brassica cretica]|uniref:Aspartic peptidase DDI1-type domain-containing protein n=2 Tax=Brassica cretica TaxID=69181 RepID=A0ABQ7AJL1_BRACR|nr:hypothetical protein DY000_02053746 [Brassica cretica]